MNKTGCITCKRGSWNHHANDDLRPTFNCCTFSDKEIEDNCKEHNPMLESVQKIVWDSMNRYNKQGVKL